MKSYKYLIFIFLIFSTKAFSANIIEYRFYGSYHISEWNQSPQTVCSSAIGKIFANNVRITSSVAVPKSTNVYYCRMSGVENSTGQPYLVDSPSSDLQTRTVQQTCPSAQEINLKVALNAQTYQCVQSCQYRLTACVDVDFEAGMTCTAISTGLTCGSTPPPTNTSGTTTPDTGTPATPNQTSTGTNTNTSTTTGTTTTTSTSTATSTTENNTTTTNTTTNTTITNNTTTKIDLSSLESTIKSIGSILGSKLDSIKESLSGTPNGNGTDLTETNQKLDDIKNNGQKTNNWLQGKNEDGTGGGISDNPFGTDQTPEKALTPQDLETNIFVGTPVCPADRTLSFQLFTGKTFSKTFSFAMWCDKLTIFGTLILIASYLYAAYIITSKS